MRLIVAAIGKLPKSPERELVERYQTRLEQLARTVRLGPAALVELEARGADAKSGAASKRLAEGALLLKALRPAEKIIALDERGENCSSSKLADRLGGWRDAGVGVVGFAIGGADGLTDDLRDQAALRLSFGQLTWPHALARAMLFEQLYRAGALLAGHPYHRE
ncbi:MAG: 23S rRNA (pseudouridine(1915)-N(3))-methyltransferase RlmH [Neomegalonema sp.]|nr:23S rRNA (pseudouridine(1915)-N(3))-methyltransferase RlmH [Neomegalonema sp.]